VTLKATVIKNCKLVEDKIIGTEKSKKRKTLGGSRERGKEKLLHIIARVKALM